MGSEMKIVVPIAILLLTACMAKSDTKEAALARIRALTKDPKSVIFENVSVDEKTGVVCGEFNAKNSFGALAGSQAFVDDGMKTIIEGDATFETANGKCETGSPTGAGRQRNLLARAQRKLDLDIQAWEKAGEEAVRK